MTTPTTPALDVDAPVALELLRGSLAMHAKVSDYEILNVPIGDLRAIEQYITTLTTALRAAQRERDALRVAAGNVVMCFTDWPQYGSSFADSERSTALRLLAEASAITAARGGGSNG